MDDNQVGISNSFSGREFVVQAGSIGDIHLHPVGEDKDDESKDRRQSFLFGFYGQALRQADITFRMSMIFMSIGAVVVIAGVALALLRSSISGREYVALISSISGVVVGSCGGAFAIHANKARRHLTKQAERMDSELRSDRKLEQTLRLIDQIDDPVLKDRLKSITAMKVLDFKPSPETIASHVLAPKLEAGAKGVDSADGRDED